MTTRAQVIAAIVTAIAVDHGGGFDLSPSGRVQRGRWDAPAAGAPAFACVSGTELVAEHGPVLHQFEYTRTVEVRAWAPIAGMAMEQRVGAAEVALDAIVDALNAARLTPGTAIGAVRSWRVEGGVADGAVDKIPPGFALAIALVTFTVAWRPS